MFRCVKLTDEGLMSLLPKCLSLRSLNLYALSRLALKLDAKFKLYCPGISLIHIITIIQFHRCSLQELRSSITSEVFGSLWCPGKKYWVSSVISGQPNLMQTTNDTILTRRIFQMKDSPVFLSARTLNPSI